MFNSLRKRKIEARLDSNDDDTVEKEIPKSKQRFRDAVKSFLLVVFLVTLMLLWSEKNNGKATQQSTLYVPLSERQRIRRKNNEIRTIKVPRAASIRQSQRDNSANSNQKQGKADQFYLPQAALLGESYEEARMARGPIVELLAQTGRTLDLETLQRLPKWSQVTDLYGDEPVVIGMETCEAFREAIPTERRFVGVAGQMNVGTNALGLYFTHNLQIPSNPHKGGVLKRVPWHKHGWVSMRNSFRDEPNFPTNHTWVLPVIAIREPFYWMQSMCESPYVMTWNHTAEHCPNLGSPVSIQWGEAEQRTWPSMLHAWNDYYREYLDADFPRLMIRFEDLLFHAPQVLQSVRECVGAKWKHNHVLLLTEPAKNNAFFDKVKPQSDLLSAMIKYGSDSHHRVRSLTADERRYVRDVIDYKLIDAFHYKLPASVS